MPIPPDATNDVPIMTTERLELSFGTPEDASVLFPYVSGDAGRAVTDFLLWDGPAGPEDLTGFFSKHATGTYAESGFHWLLRDRTGDITGTAGEAMGSIGIRTTDAPDSCDLGYWIAEPFWGRGLMAEAISAVVATAFEHWRLDRVGADVFTTNDRSIKLLEKLGFLHVGSMPAYNIKRGCPVDGLHFELRRLPAPADPNL